MLAAYDLFVLGFLNRFVWRCPWPRLLARYDRHKSANHLDVAAGTGFLPDHCRLPFAQPRLVLLDLKASSAVRTTTPTA